MTFEILNKNDVTIVRQLDRFQIVFDNCVSKCWLQTQRGLMVL